MTAFDRRGKKSAATRMRHRIWVQVKQETSDGEGGYTTAWQNYREIWAEVLPITAKQRMEYLSMDVEATHLIRCRGLIDVPETYRIMFGTREFEVLTVENLQERDVENVITCKERRQE